MRNFGEIDFSLSEAARVVVDRQSRDRSTLDDLFPHLPKGKIIYVRESSEAAQNAPIRDVNSVSPEVKRTDEVAKTQKDLVKPDFVTRGLENLNVAQTFGFATVFTDNGESVTVSPHCCILPEFRPIAEKLENQTPANLEQVPDDRQKNKTSLNVQKKALKPNRERQNLNLARLTGYFRGKLYRDGKLVIREKLTDKFKKSRRS